MSDNPMDIKDDEIRVISPESQGAERPAASGLQRRGNAWLWIAAVAVIIVVTAGIFLLSGESDPVAVESDPEETPAPLPASTPVAETLKGFTAVTDTTVNNVPLTILTPLHSTPELSVGQEILGDTSAVLVVQAADVRGDNGAIAGAFVMKGDLISKGKAKAGFCSIIDGNITIGVADATPLLEQALEQEGYFFRQYPLVVSGQIVENKPRGRALRKALAELDGRYCVVISRRALTFHDFAQTLVDLGARNAIYLVGGESRGFYVDGGGTKTAFSPDGDSRWENLNFLVWR